MTLTLASALVLTGCTAPPPQTVAVSSPTVAPVFASDEEALAAAVEAYEKYLAVSTAIAHDGGNGIERLSRVSVGSALHTDEATFASFREQRLTGTGEAAISTSRLKTFDRTGGVEMYVCTDVSRTDVVSADGASTVDVTRSGIIPFELRLEWVEETKELLVSNSEVWVGTSFC